MHRLHLSVPDPAPAALALPEDKRHYVEHVLRLTEGDALEVFDGAGHAWDARLLAGGLVALGARREARAARPLAVVQGLPKGDKLELVLQKGTELGAAAFHPVACARSVVKLEPRRAQERVQRWGRIAEEAARQCGRADVPAVHAPLPLEEAARALAGRGVRLLVLDEEERARPLGEAFRALPREAAVAVVVGPEGGLAREEVQALAALGAVPVTLGRRVLRTETAALAALAVMGHLDGELG